MTYGYDDLIAIQEIVRDAARHNLMVYFARSTADYKADGSIVTEADLAMQQSLTAALAESYPDVQMLGEEVSEDSQLAVVQGDGDYWCLDPVDGTTNFHATVPLFSVSLALISGGEVVLGLVYDPNRQEFFGAIKDQGFWIDGKRSTRPIQPDRLERCIAFTRGRQIRRETVRDVLAEVEESLDSIREHHATLEREALMRAIRETGGNITRAAEALGRSRGAVYRLIDKHNIPLRRRR